MDPLAIAAVGWLMSALVSKAVTALLEAWAKGIGLGNEFKTLKDQLLQLGALLTSARRLRTNNTYLDELVQNLQQLAYQAENLLDELDYYRLKDEIHQRGIEQNVNCSNGPSAASSSSGFRLTSHSILSTLKGKTCCSTSDALEPIPKTISSRINLSRRINELAMQLQKYEKEVRKAVDTESLVITSQNTEISQTEATNLPQTSPFHTELRKVVGRDQERDQLINLLTSEETAMLGKVHVVAIVGCGGVGKTTLAGLVFNNPNIESFFDVRSWICVSTHFDIVRLIREMLEGAWGNRYDDVSNLAVLQTKLKNKLETKRFLLVLDDMWEDKAKNQWDNIIALLNNCRMERGIILVTTRNKSVAEMVNERDNIYLHGLDDNAFLSFFSTCIFNNSNYGGNWRLKKIGQEIANKLKGNPLAAKTVSALLKRNLDESYWMEIRDSEKWKSQSDPNDIMPSLLLSYEHMPFHLQRCFSYFAIFPKNHRFFSCTELVNLWNAQGFLDARSEGERMEDVGSAYFIDLLNRGFLEANKYSVFHLVFYTFHDLFHDLACMLSIKACLTIDGTKLRQIPPTIRHLSISGSTESSKDAIVTALACLKGENLSTIIIWDDELPSGVCLSISDLLKKTKFLRAMRLKLGSMVQQHNFIQNFVSLRYLSLNIGILPGSINTTSQSLPGEICKLYHLEVFKIEGMFLDELPNDFCDLVSLRYFVVDGKLHSKIWGVGKLTSLQELNHFDVQQKIGFQIEQLGTLKEIRGPLKIWNLENVKCKEEASRARLVEKDELDGLYLQWNHGEQENESILEGLKPNPNLKYLQIIGYGGLASPIWLDPSLIFLKSIILENCKAWELLPPLGELSVLEQLTLSGMSLREIGPQWYGTHRSMKFPSLESLSIIDMPDLEKWVRSDQLQAFVCLRKLKRLLIVGCSKLVDLPLSGITTSEVLERFPSLESLHIKDCPLILQLTPLPYSSLFSIICIERTGFIKYMNYLQFLQKLSLIQDECSILKLGELLAFHELSSLHVLEISDISSLESLNLHSFVALKNLLITGCQSLTSITFGEHLVCLRTLTIISCKALSSIKGLKSWVNLVWLEFRKCPGFIAAWDFASKEIERTQPDFSLSLTKIKGSLAHITLPICRQLTSLRTIELEFSTFTEGHELSLQLLTSIDLVDINGCTNLQSFPFLMALIIKFPHIQSLPESSCREIIEECKKLRNIGEVEIITPPVQIVLTTSTWLYLQRAMDMRADECS